MGMTIGTVAGAAGVNVSTVRYYERRGMIEEPPRTASGYRQYDQAVVDRLRFIRQAQDLGFTLDEIQDLLELRVERPGACPAVAEATEAKLQNVESRVHRLKRLRAVLTRLVASCDAREPSGPCPVLETLENGGRA